MASNDPTDAERAAPMPMGCLGCSPQAESIAAILTAHGKRAFEVPPPRHAWSDIIQCDACERWWCVAPLLPLPTEARR